jgi:thioredoxin reductase
MDNFKKHAEVSGSEIENGMVEEVSKHDDHFHLKMV